MPIHFAVFVADVGCKKLTSSNVETLFSGAGYMSKKAPTMSDELLQMYVFIFYNSKYEWLLPSTDTIVKAYLHLHKTDVEEYDSSSSSDNDSEDEDEVMTAMDIEPPLV